MACDDVRGSQQTNYQARMQKDTIINQGNSYSKIKEAKDICLPYSSSLIHYKKDFLLRCNAFSSVAMGVYLVLQRACICDSFKSITTRFGHRAQRMSLNDFGDESVSIEYRLSCHPPLKIYFSSGGYD